MKLNSTMTSWPSLGFLNLVGVFDFSWASWPCWEFLILAYSNLFVLFQMHTWGLYVRARKILEKCAAPLLEDTRGPLIIESVHCLTKDPDPRTKCWRVVVPPGFKDIMENSLLYPEGWRYREFVGIFRNSNKTAKKIKMSDNIVDQVMAEVSQQPGQGSDLLLHSLHQQVMQLVQQQAGGASGPPVTQPLQGWYRGPRN